MEGEEVVRFVNDQLMDVQSEQPGLELALESTGELVIRGNVVFSILHKSREYSDSYQLEIAIPKDYPDSLPVAKETAGAIPLDFHRHTSNGELCLAAPVEMVRVFAKDRTIRNYIDRLIIPYLFSCTFFRAHGLMPYGELSHGISGVLEYYCEFFTVKPIVALKILKLLADDSAPPLLTCPCGSDKTLQNCHGPLLDELRPLLPPSHFERELRELISAARGSRIKLPEEAVIPTRMLRNQRKRSRKDTRIK